MELQLQNLALSFKNKPNVIHDISLTMNGGSIVGIVAPNGTGKTTLLRLILNDLKPQALAQSFEERETDYQCARHAGLHQSTGAYLFNGHETAIMFWHGHGGQHPDHATG